MNVDCIIPTCKALKEMGIPHHFTCLPKNLCAGQEVKELDMEQMTGSKLGKKYVKAVYCHPDYFMPMQRTSCEMLGWMNHKLESRLLREIPINSDMQMIPSNGRKQRETKEPLSEDERGEWKSWLKLSIQRMMIMAPSPITSWQIDEKKKWKQWQILFSWAPKSPWTVTAAMNLKDTCSLEKKLQQT